MSFINNLVANSVASQLGPANAVSYTPDLILTSVCLSVGLFYGGNFLVQ